MSKQIYELGKGDERAIEKVLFDENIHYLHMVFPQNEGLPVHNANSTVYMTVVRGTLSIGLNDEVVEQHPAGTLLKIPFQTKMDVKNRGEEILELIVVKSPAPAV